MARVENHCTGPVSCLSGALLGTGDFPKPQGELVAELEQDQGSHLLSGPVLHTHTRPAGLGCLLGWALGPCPPVSSWDSGVGCFLLTYPRQD